MKNLLAILKKAYREEKGAEGLEKILLIAAIVLPLLGLLLFFKDEITDWMQGNYEEVRGESDSYDPEF